MRLAGAGGFSRPSTPILSIPQELNSRRRRGFPCLRRYGSGGGVHVAGIDDDCRSHSAKPRLLALRVADRPCDRVANRFFLRRLAAQPSEGLRIAEAGERRRLLAT